MNIVVTRNARFSADVNDRRAVAPQHTNDRAGTSSHLVGLLNAWGVFAMLPWNKRKCFVSTTLLEYRSVQF